MVTDMIRRIFLSLAAVAMLLPGAAMAERVRDLGQFQGVRSNQLTGYGIVVGLPGTGDDNLEYLTQAMKGVSGRMGLNLPAGVAPGQRTRNGTRCPPSQMSAFWPRRPRFASWP